MIRFKGFLKEGEFDFLMTSTKKYKEKGPFKKHVYRGERKHRFGGELYASDPGDLGRGIYYSSSIHFARSYGDKGHAKKYKIKLQNPVYLSVADIRELGKQFNTIHGSTAERLKAAQAMTDYFKEKGHDGIVAHGYEGKDDLTVVVFT